MMRKKKTSTPTSTGQRTPQSCLRNGESRQTRTSNTGQGIPRQVSVGPVVSLKEEEECKQGYANQGHLFLGYSTPTRRYPDKENRHSPGHPPRPASNTEEMETVKCLERSSAPRGWPSCHPRTHFLRGRQKKNGIMHFEENNEDLENC